MAIRHPKNRGFTLVELLVVISIIALLMAILMPSLQTAREQSRQVVCGTNLHAIGQGIFVYAHDHDDLLVPGNHSVSWNVWAEVPDCYQEVNLGYLMTANALPVPSSEESVFFCPSMKPSTTRQTSGELYFDYETFDDGWQQDTHPAPINYMYNTALDGFGNAVVSGTWAILSHQTRIQYLMPDGSVHTFKVTPQIYDSAVGPELLQDVSQRLGVNFPALLLHRWFSEGQVDLDEAADYLANPAAWMNTHADSATEETATRLRLAQVKNTSVVSDVVGAWDVTARDTPPQPG